MIEKIVSFIITKAVAADTTGSNIWIHVPTGNSTDKTALDWVSILDTIQGVIDMMLYLAGGFAIFGFVIGAFMYVSAMGDDTKAAAAKKQMIWSVIGLLVVIFARFIIMFVQNLLK